jgi:prophage regulatory protein
MLNERILRKKEVLSVIGLSDTTLWRMEKTGQFPKRINLGGNSVGWLSSEIQKWIKLKAEKRQDRKI